jgi:ribokinase
MKKLLVIGSLTLDILADLDKIPKIAEIGLVRRSRILFGGRGANVAVISAKLGLSVSLATLVGADFPIEYRNHLVDSGVGLTRLRTIEEAHCTRFYAFTDPFGRASYVLEPIKGGADNRSLLLRGDNGRFDGIAVAPLHSCDRHLFDTELGKFRTVFLMLGKEVYWKSRSYIKKALRYPHFVFLNEDELDRCMEVLELEHPEELVSLGPRMRALVVTAAERGARAYTLSKVIESPAVPTLKRTEIGGGDSYAAGFISSILTGSSVADGMRMGSVVASLALEREYVQSVKLDSKSIRSKLKLLDYL